MKVFFAAMALAMLACGDKASPTVRSIGASGSEQTPGTAESPPRDLSPKNDASPPNAPCTQLRDSVVREVEQLATSLRWAPDEQIVHKFIDDSVQRWCEDMAEQEMTGSELTRIECLASHEGALGVAALHACELGDLFSLYRLDHRLHGDTRRSEAEVMLLSQGRWRGRDGEFTVHGKDFSWRRSSGEQRSGYLGQTELPPIEALLLLPRHTHHVVVDKKGSRLALATASQNATGPMDGDAPRFFDLGDGNTLIVSGAGCRVWDHRGILMDAKCDDNDEEFRITAGPRQWDTLRLGNTLILDSDLDNTFVKHRRRGK